MKDSDITLQIDKKIDDLKKIGSSVRGKIIEWVIEIKIYLEILFLYYFTNEKVKRKHLRELFTLL